MRKIPVEQFAGDLDDLFTAAQSERVLVTRRGKPVAVVMGVNQLDEEDADYVTDPAFRRMIEERRKQRTIPLAQVKARIAAEEKRLAELERAGKKTAGGKRRPS